MNREAAQLCEQKLMRNVWAQPSRCSPNGQLLQHGAIQRASVTLDAMSLRYTHMNPKRIGHFKRPEHNTKSSNVDNAYTAPWDTQRHRHKIARIYMPQRKHVHCHPTNKTVGKYWAIEFDSATHFKSPLMGWTSATHDSFACGTSGMGVHAKYGRLQDAVSYCEANGWGYDILMPQGQRWHTKKNYADNFKWKGEAPEREAYD